MFTNVLGQNYAVSVVNCVVLFCGVAVLCRGQGSDITPFNQIMKQHESTLKYSFMPFKSHTHANNKSSYLVRSRLFRCIWDRIDAGCKYLSYWNNAAAVCLPQEPGGRLWRHRRSDKPNGTEDRRCRPRFIITDWIEVVQFDLAK